MPKSDLTVVREERTTPMPIGALIEDLSIYPRHEVNEQHVANLVKALEAGVRFPPLVASASDKRITDGWHRRRAILRWKGEAAVVDVVLREYQNNHDLLLDAISMNSGHGKPLDSIDYVRCTAMCSELGIPDTIVAAALQQSVAQVQKYKVRVAYVPVGSDDVVPGSATTVVLKRPVSHLAGQQLTETQANALSRVPGMPYRLLAYQLIDATRLGFADRRDESLIRVLRELRDELNQFFEKQGNSPDQV